MRYLLLRLDSFDPCFGDDFAGELQTTFETVLIKVPDSIRIVKPETFTWWELFAIKELASSTRGKLMASIEASRRRPVIDINGDDKNNMFLWCPVAC